MYVYYRTLTKGNLVSWDDAEFDLVNTTEKIRSLRSICKPIKPGHVIFPERRDFVAHNAICHKMRGLPSVVENEKILKDLNKRVQRHESCLDPKKGK